MKSHDKIRVSFMWQHWLYITLEMIVTSCQQLILRLSTQLFGGPDDVSRDFYNFEKKDMLLRNTDRRLFILMHVIYKKNSSILIVLSQKLNKLILFSVPVTTSNQPCRILVIILYYFSFFSFVLVTSESP